jgi:dipeptidyl aminopeptidase/acylaminoacyl peptidase
MLARFLITALTVIGATFGGAVAAQTLSIEDVWKRPAIAEPKLSPNGRYFAVLAPVNDRLNLAVIDLETRKGVALTNFRDYDVRNVYWVGNERLVFTLGQFNAPSGAGLQEGGGFFMVSRDGKESRQISPTVRDLRRQNQFVYRAYSYHRSIPDSDEEIIAEGNLRSQDSSDLYRLNVKTGKATLLTQDRPPRVQFSGASDGEPTVTWVLDRNLLPRAAVSSIKDTTTTVVHYRKDEKSPWVELTRFDAAKGPVMFPLSFERDNETMLVANGANRATIGVYRYNPNTKTLGTVVAEHPRFDMGANQFGEPVPGPLFDPKTEDVVGFRVDAEKLETVWVDDGYRRIQAMIDKALPETINTFRRTPDGNRLIITSFADRHPTRWYLLDEKNRTLEELFSSRPWVKPEQLAEMVPFTFKTRDGLEISSYYFLPKGYKKGDKVPTVVHVHGGPFARADFWGRWGFGFREAQLLASRGYAVVVPNFRITPGLGNKIFYSGFGAYGREMVADHADAAKWAIDQGFADPQRICISGASYGGSAVLMSMAQHPDIFRCGVAGLVVVDKQLQLTSPAGDIAYSESAVRFWLSVLGGESTSKIPPITSPVTYAEKIKGPVMMYAGVDDIRTPLEQTRAMQRALERAGNAPRAMVVKAEEGHGFGKLENNVDLYNVMFKFLDEQIGPKSKR